MSCALYFLSFTISNISSMLSQIDTKKNLLRQKMIFIDEFSKEVRLGKRLKKELQNKLLDNIDRFAYSYEDRMDLINNFSKELRLEISLTMHKGFAARFDVFYDEDDTLLLNILPLMENLVIKGLQTVYSVGEYSSKMYFIIRGRVHFLLTNESSVFQVYREGSYFGDVEAIFNIPRLNSAVTATECKLLIMNADILKKIDDHYSHFYNKLKKNAKSHYSFIQKNTLEMKTIMYMNKNENTGILNSKMVKEAINRESLKINTRESLLRIAMPKSIESYDLLIQTRKSMKHANRTIKNLCEFIDAKLK